MPFSAELPNSAASHPGPTRLARRLLTLRPVRFIAVGVLNSAFGYGLFAVFFLASNRRQMALVAATIVGAVFNFFTTGRLVFANRGLEMLLPFLLAYAVVLGVNMALLEGFTRIGLPTLAAQAIAMPAVVVLSYVTNRYAVFAANCR